MAAHWVGTWTATPAPADGVSLSSPTIRMFPRISVGGDAIRIRLSNAAGKGDLVVASTHVAHRGEGVAAIRPSTGRVVTFNGAPAVKIPAGIEDGRRVHVRVDVAHAGAELEFAGPVGSRSPW